MPTRKVAIVVNRVDLAREVFRRASEAWKDDATVVLLTGRVRPLDRERILAMIEPLFARKDPPPLPKPFFLVATQTVEVGADLDMDALVTEIAPLDSLRQRFGRLDRLGLRGRSRGVIVHPRGHPPQEDADVANPWIPIGRIYGDAAWKSLQWLQGRADGLDMGVAALLEPLRQLRPDSGTPLLDFMAPISHAPVLLPPYAELWAMTRPAPRATPEPSLFLHSREIAPDLTVVWRADVDMEDMEATLLALELCPPSSLEGVSVPVWAAKHWLEDSNLAYGVADVPAREQGSDRATQSVTVLRWRAGDWGAVKSTDLAPGDVIVVPSRKGGCDAWGWDPGCQAEVRDLGTEAHYLQRRRGALRISSRTLSNAWAFDEGPPSPTEVGENWSRILQFLEEQDDDFEPSLLCHWLDEEALLPPSWRPLLTAIASNHPSLHFFSGSDRTKGFVLLGEHPLPTGLFKPPNEGTEEGANPATAEDDSSFMGREVTLADHGHHVAENALDFARRSGLSESTARVLGLAGLLHDLGKADPRFQADLRAAGRLLMRDPDLAVSLLREGEPIAKSASQRPGPTDPKGRANPRAVPKWFRHEALSVTLAERHPDVERLTDEDRDLALWLIGTHHGYGRPFFPPCEDPSPRMEVVVRGDGWAVVGTAGEAPLRLDQLWFDLAVRVNRRFGPWELARLEAIVRLADHAASESERGGIGV